MNYDKQTIKAMNNGYYDIQQIKGIAITDYLEAQGILPIKRYGSYAIYNAPYRDDRNASLKVDFARNLWYDYDAPIQVTQ